MSDGLISSPLDLPGTVMALYGTFDKVGYMNLYAGRYQFVILKGNSSPRS